MSKQEKLLDLTHKIVYAIGIVSHEEFESDEEKQCCFDMLESMQFFVDQGNYDRAISEGENLLKKLNK